MSRLSWGEFKMVVEEQGAKDDDEIFYIDWSVLNNPIIVLRGEDNTIAVDRSHLDSQPCNHMISRCYSPEECPVCEVERLLAENKRLREALKWADRYHNVWPADLRNEVDALLLPAPDAGG